MLPCLRFRSSEHVNEAVSGGKTPAGKGVKIVCQADMART